MMMGLISSLGIGNPSASAGEIKTTKAIVIYFSRAGMNYWHGGEKQLDRGNTARMADVIQKAIDADVYEIVPVCSYPFDYRETTALAEREKTADLRPAIQNPMPDLSEYDVIFLGHPIWWGDMPMILRSFLDRVSLKGKTVAHFCTHEGSGFGDSDRDLRSRAGAAFVPGLAAAGTRVDGMTEEIQKWSKNSLKIER